MLCLMLRVCLAVLCIAVTLGSLAAEKNAYFGDLHIHTRYSYDAFFFGTATGPDEAYAYAKGQPLEHPAGFAIQLDRPLDFYAVTDHAYFLGQWWSVKTRKDHPLKDDPAAQSIAHAGTAAERGSGGGWRLGALRRPSALAPPRCTYLPIP